MLYRFDGQGARWRFAFFKTERREQSGIALQAALMTREVGLEGYESWNRNARLHTQGVATREFWFNYITK